MRLVLDPAYNLVRAIHSRSPANLLMVASQRGQDAEAYRVNNARHYATDCSGRWMVLTRASYSSGGARTKHA
jgi:hypothetical protein